MGRENCADASDVATTGPTQAEPNTDSWSGRPGLSRALRLTAYLGPTLASLVATFYITRFHPPTNFDVPVWQWWIFVFTVGVGVLLITDRLARRLLPLAALFKLSLAFPNEAPSRFGVAMRSGTTRQIQRRIEEIRESGIETDETQHAEVMLELVAALSVHDRMTRGHCERVRAYTDMLIEELGINERDAGKLRWAALLHDVGKIHVPTEVLNKNGRPSEVEWELLKSHTWHGDRMIAPLRPWLGEWADAIGSHHERWDGDGYPAGVGGSDINYGARIVAVADAFDVMTSTRSYKKPIKAEEARAEIARCAGTQFDPKVVRAFLNIGIGRLRLAIGPLSWAANIPAAGQAPIAPAITPVATAATAGLTATVAVVTGGFFGLLSPDAEVPEAVAFADEPIATTTTVFVPETTVRPTTTQPTTTTSPPTTTSTPSPTSSIPTKLSPTTNAPTTVPATTTSTTTASTTTTTVTVPPVPVALSTSVNLFEDGSLAIDLAALSSNGSLDFNLVNPPALGTVVVLDDLVVGSATPNANPNGETNADPNSPINQETDIDIDTGTDTGPVRVSRTAVYTVNPNANGSDSFSFEACELASPYRCSSGEVNLTIEQVNDAPTTSSSTSTSTNEDSPSAPLDAVALAAASDVDNDVLSVQWGTPSVAGIATATAEGLRFTPPQDFNGLVEVPYNVCDGTDCTPAVLELTVVPVNDRPTASPLTLSVNEDEPRTVTSTQLLAAVVNDVDTASSQLQFSFVDPGTGSFSSSPTGFFFQNDLDSTAPVSITYSVCDGGSPSLCALSTVDLSYVPINDAPIVGASSRSASEDTPITVTTTSILAESVSDIDDANSALDLTYSLVNPGGVLDTSIAGQFTYTPVPNATTDVKILVTACDPSLLCGSAELTLVFSTSNDAPVALGFTKMGTEDTTTSITTADLFPKASDVDNPDTDLTWTFQTTNKGTFSNVTATSFDFNPKPDATADVSITYEVCDLEPSCDTATITLKFTPVNDAPTAISATVLGGEDVTTSVTTTELFLATNDIDNTDSDLTFSFVKTSGPGALSNVSPTGFDYIPDPDSTPTVLVDYTVCDLEPKCATGTLTLTFAAANDAPVASVIGLLGTEDTTRSVDYAILSGSAADVDNADSDLRWTFSVSTGTLTNVTATSFDYVPATNATGPVTIDYEVCDLEPLCDTSTINLFLNPVNDAPILGAIPTQTLVAGKEIAPISIPVSDVDNTVASLAWTPTLPNGLFVDPADQKIKGTPSASNKGSTFAASLTVKDPAGAPATTSFQIIFEDEAVSPLAGKIAITEVLHHRTTTATLSRIGVHDDFIEITNISTENISLDGLSLRDFDASNGVEDNVIVVGNLANTSFDYTFGALDQRGDSSLLAPGESAVIWTGDPDGEGYWVTGTVGGFPVNVYFNLQTFPHAPATAREYLIGEEPWPILSTEGDDLWLYDSNDDLVDFVAWDNQSADSQRSGAPTPYLDQWNALDEMRISGSVNGHSISLGTTTDFDDVSCWARTTDPADASCTDPHVTLDTDTFFFGLVNRVSSAGQPNFN